MTKTTNTTQNVNVNKNSSLNPNANNYFAMHAGSAPTSPHEGTKSGS